jgi:cytochrome c-type biogenesis protein CcmH/NrfG
MIIFAVSNINRKSINYSSIMKKIFLVLVAIGIAFSVFAQSQKAQELVERGIQYHDQGKYSLAISKYQEALKLEPKFSAAYYEMAHSYYAQKDYDNAIKNAKKVIKLKQGNESQAYVLIGNIYDMQGKFSKAVKTYKTGIKSFPGDHMLYFNLAITYYSHKDYKLAEENFIESIKINPRHASSHYYLGLSLEAQGKKFQAILPMTYALMIEPIGKRSTIWLKWIKKELQYNVEKKGNTINISIDSDFDKDKFSTAKMMYTMSMGLVIGTDSIEKTEINLFSISLQKYIESLNLVTLDQNDFYNIYYKIPMGELDNLNLISPFCYHILQSTKEDEVKDWITNHEEEITKFDNWFKQINDEHTNIKK